MYGQKYALPAILKVLISNYKASGSDQVQYGDWQLQFLTKQVGIDFKK